MTGAPSTTPRPADRWRELLRRSAVPQEIVDASVEFAKAGTDPKPEDALKYVYA